MALIKEVRGFTPKIAQDVYLAEDATIIGDVEIAAGSSVWFKTVIRGDVNSIRIGKNVNIQDGSILHATYNTTKTIIEDSVSIGHAVILHGCHIGEGSLIGMGSIVMDNAVIPKNSLVGAGSLVTENASFPAGHLILGRPARVIRPLNDQELNALKQSEANYLEYMTWYK